MKIKRFVQINIVLSILLIGLLYILSWIYINYVNDRTVKFMEYNKLPNNSVDLVVLGSSHGKFGIKLEQANQMNLGLEQQGMYYNLKILEKYEEKIKDGATVIIPISIFTFNEGKVDSDMSKDEIYKNYVNILEKKDIRKPLTESQYFLMNKFSIIYPPARMITLFKWMVTCYKENKIFKNKIIYKRNNLKKNFFEKAREKILDQERKLKKEDYNYALEITKKLLKKLKNKRIKVVIIIVPLTKEYNQAMLESRDKIFQKAIYENIEKIKHFTSDDLIFLDYSHDKRFENNKEYFMDDDHLNEKGAEYFTKILLKDMEERLKKDE